MGLCIVAIDRVQLGTSNPDKEEVNLLDQDGGNNTCTHDLLDVIPQETLTHGGTPFVVPIADISGSSVALAAARY